MSTSNSGNIHHEDSDAANLSPGKGERHSARNPACDLCREKKVRCGREKPTCQNCIAWKTPCTYSERQKRENEASRNAQRFEEVYDRLDRIESTMLRLVAALETSQANVRPPIQTPPASMFRPPIFPDTPTSTTTHPAPDPCGGYSLRLPKIPNSRRDVQYLGPSSMLSISIEAGSLAEETLRQKSPQPSPARGGGSASASQADPRLEALGETLRRNEQFETIGALKKLSSISSNVASWFPYYGHQELRLGAGDASMQIPEREEAEELVNEYFQRVYVWLPIFDEVRFKENMEKYYAGDPKLVNDRAWLVCFNNVLLFGVFSRTVSRVAVQAEAGRNYFLNGWAAIDDLEVFLAPRLRNIQALVTGAVIAIEISRPGLCWSLLSQAARLSQAIGLHRRNSNNAHLSKSEIQERRYIFWNVYILDKCLSLTFGRSTCLPDFDCDVELPEDDGSNPYFKNFIALIRLAKIQSNIYIRLYSASTVRLTEEEREKSISELDAELRGWWDEEKPIFFDADGEMTTAPKGAGGTDTSERPLDVYSKMELRFSYLCSLTLVHRTARPGMVAWATSERTCLESARESIMITKMAVESNFDIANSGMIMWLFQYYPFTAFFVLFSAIIRNPSAQSSKTVDFPLMKSLVSYLSRMKEKNDGAAKLLQVASAFTHVAGTFLKNYGKIEQQREHAGKRRRREVESEDEDVEVEVDTQLEPEETWLQEGVRDGERTFTKGHGKGFWGTTAFPRDQVEQIIPTASIPQRQGENVAGYEPSISAATMSEEDGFGEVDLHPASFLKWPEQDGQGLPMDLGVGESSRGDNPTSGGPPFDMDLQSLMAEPEGFQMQMEQAAMRGPLDFDWFSWEGST